MDEKETSNVNDLTLSTPPNVLSSKSSDISFEELGIEESEELEVQLASNPETVQDDASKASEDTADSWGLAEEVCNHSIEAAQPANVSQQFVNLELSHNNRTSSNNNGGKFH